MDSGTDGRNGRMWLRVRARQAAQGKLQMAFVEEWRFNEQRMMLAMAKIDVEGQDACVGSPAGDFCLLS